MASKSNKSNSLPIYILNGPNLNLLGTREPEIYGRATLADIGKAAQARARSHGFKIVFRQSNREGELVDWVQEARVKAAGLILNPAGYGHTSVALLDALLALKIPVIEVHLSNPQKREAFRHHSFVSKAATGTICGFGALGYNLAIDALANILADIPERGA